jgi:hypothetical protein
MRCPRSMWGGHSPWSMWGGPLGCLLDRGQRPRRRDVLAESSSKFQDYPNVPEAGSA